MIKHDEKHRFLDWGPMDGAFEAWQQHLDDKGVPYEVAINTETGHATIYKHMMYTDMGTGMITPCCIENDPFALEGGDG
jgi:hypothetical protein